MAKTRTIGNPLSWSAQSLGRTGTHLADMVGHVRSDRADTPPKVQQIGMQDIRDALRAGMDDFAVFRSDVMFLCLFYPVIGLALVWAAFNAALAPFVFPLMAGFALLGPVAAIGLYELSRRREMGAPASWGDAAHLFSAPSVGAMVLLGLVLLTLFLGWMGAAFVVYLATMGPEMPASASAFIGDVFGTGAGWMMMLIGIPVGAAFAAVVLAISIVSFPLLLDRDVGLPRAVATSWQVTRENPKTVAAWGLIVAVGLVLGSIPAFLGLILVMPVLGHATWHLYRRAVA